MHFDEMLVTYAFILLTGVAEPGGGPFLGDPSPRGDSQLYLFFPYN